MSVQIHCVSVQIHVCLCRYMPSPIFAGPCIEHTPTLPQVIGNEICFERDHYQHLIELFHSRELMHRQVYTHRYCYPWARCTFAVYAIPRGRSVSFYARSKVAACNLMLADALVEVEPVS